MCTPWNIQIRKVASIRSVPALFFYTITHKIIRCCYNEGDSWPSFRTKDFIIGLIETDEKNGVAPKSTFKVKVILHRKYCCRKGILHWKQVLCWLVMK